MGIIIVILALLSVPIMLLVRHMIWSRSRPKVTIGGVGIRYNPGTHDWPGFECVIAAIRREIAAKFGTDLAETFLSHVIIEVVKADASRSTPYTIVSEQTHTAGSIDSEREFPWSTKVGVAVVLQRNEYATAGQGAAAHEIIKHLLSIHLGRGENDNHAYADLNMMVRIIENECH